MQFTVKEAQLGQHAIQMSNLNLMDKVLRKNLLEQQKRIKPGECLKYIKAVIDPQFLSSGEAESKVISSLTKLGIKTEIRSLKTPGTIIWERSNQQTITKSDEKMVMSEKYSQENQVLYLIQGGDLIEYIKSNTLKMQIEDLCRSFLNFKITLLIYGLKNFCRKNDVQIPRIDVEKSLTELQILYGLSHRLQETAEEIGSTVVQFSKAVAEIPFKKQQMEKFANENVFLENDNKDCVRVEGTAGLSRLWQQHLTRLPLVTLEIAETIIKEYPTPRDLFEAYKNNPEAANILADLKIRRSGGPLSNERRIGSELSKRIYILYNSMDPNEKL